MCGVVGYLGRRRAARVLVAGLKKLEYRGYDSAGIAVLEGETLHVLKRAGRVAGLWKDATFAGDCGIGHTRWATHGAPTEANAHPHVYGSFAVVHNGIIENFSELRAACIARGETFSSETDSEVIAHLLERFYAGDFIAALRKTCACLKGSYAIAALRKGKREIALARLGSPLVVGVRKGELLCASDVPAIAAKDIALYPLEDGEFALLGEEGASFYDGQGRIEKQAVPCGGAEDVPDRKGYPHFMKKEIAEIPAAIAASRPAIGLDGQYSELCEVLCHAKYLRIVACGTAYHAGLGAKYAFERLARLPVEVTVASEFRSSDPILPTGTAVIAVSQSGETADTLAAARLAAARNVPVIALTNVRYSSLASLSPLVLFTGAGREIAVAATKSYCAQLTALYSLAAAVAEAKGMRGYGDLLARLPQLAAEAIAAGEEVQKFTPYFTGASSAYFVGRGPDCVTAYEGSLKLKEISYLPSEGYAAGELKHGTLALIGQGTPVVAVITSEALAEKTMNAVYEAHSRGARVFLVTSLPALARKEWITGSVLLPPCGDVFSPAVSVIPLQLLAYYVALARGNDPDKPRNLAKSVTVE